MIHEITKIKGVENFDDGITRMANSQDGSIRKDELDEERNLVETSSFKTPDTNSPQTKPLIEKIDKFLEERTYTNPVERIIRFMPFEWEDFKKEIINSPQLRSNSVQEEEGQSNIERKNGVKPKEASQDGSVLKGQHGNGTHKPELTSSADTNLNPIDNYMKGWNECNEKWIKKLHEILQKYIETLNFGKRLIKTKKKRYVKQQISRTNTIIGLKKEALQRLIKELDEGAGK